MLLRLAWCLVWTLRRRFELPQAQTINSSIISIHFDDEFKNVLRVEIVIRSKGKRQYVGQVVGHHSLYSYLPLSHFKVNANTLVRALSWYTLMFWFIALTSSETTFLRLGDGWLSCLY